MLGAQKKGVLGQGSANQGSQAKSSHCLYLYSPQAKNNFYIFKCLKKN